MVKNLFFSNAYLTHISISIKHIQFKYVTLTNLETEGSQLALRKSTKFGKEKLIRLSYKN